MRYFLIAGEASGDLHASHLIQALRRRDPEAEFCGFGGDRMQAAGMQLLRHFSMLAFMGFVQVLLHLPTILRGMRECKRAIQEWQPDVVIYVDYPGFNLDIARWVRRQQLAPNVYYIAPKLWAWKEGRIKRVRRDIDLLLSILPFEKAFFEDKHHCPITYVGNPTLDEVQAFKAQVHTTRDDYCQRHGLNPSRPLLVLLPGSRRSEIEANLPRMLAALRLADPERQQQALIVAAPGMDRAVYQPHLSADVTLLEGQPDHGFPLAFEALHHADTALVTSGTATLETALLGTPQVVCYHISGGRIVNWLQRRLLHCRYISLVNLIADHPVVPELVAADARPDIIARHLRPLLDTASVEWREQHLHYAQLAARLQPEHLTDGDALHAPEQAAEAIGQLLHPQSE